MGDSGEIRSVDQLECRRSDKEDRGRSTETLV